MKHRGIRDYQATENLYSAALHTGFYEPSWSQAPG